MAPQEPHQDGGEYEGRVLEETAAPRPAKTLSAVGMWLVSHSLNEYVTLMEQEGYDDLEDLTALVTEEDNFERLVTREGHRRKIVRLLLPSSAHSSPALMQPSPGAPQGVSTAAVGGTPADQSSQHSYTTARSSSTNNSPSHDTQQQFAAGSVGAVLPHGGMTELGRYKVIVVGDAGTGKTSFIHQLVHSKFNGNTKATIGLDWREKQVDVAGGHVTIQFWDISGQERFANVTRAYYQGAHGAIVCYDRSNPNSLATVEKWKKDIDGKVFVGGGDEGTIIPSVLLATKCDLPDGRSESAAEVQALCAELGFKEHFETSAKQNMNVHSSIEKFVAELQHYHSPERNALHNPHNAALSKRGSTMSLVVATTAEGFDINTGAGPRPSRKTPGSHKKRCC